jgi:hypothetical protein
MPSHASMTAPEAAGSRGIEMGKPIVPLEFADVGDTIIPLFEKQATVTSVEVYRGAYPQWFTHAIYYTYEDGTKAVCAVNRRTHAKP